MDQSIKLENNRDVAPESKDLQCQIAALKSALLSAQGNIVVKTQQIQV
jgi:hypothetical protein